MEKTPVPIVDPFEFQEDPVIFEPSTKLSGSRSGGSNKQDSNYIPLYQQQPHQPHLQSGLQQSQQQVQLPQQSQQQQVQVESQVAGVCENADLKVEVKEEKDDKAEKIEQVQEDFKNNILEVSLSCFVWSMCSF